MESNLPLDLIYYEILTRASLETWGRFRLVSKESRDITYTSLFTQLSQRRTNHVSGYFVQNLRRNKYFSAFMSVDEPNSEISLNFLSAYVGIKASSNVLGLLLCVDESLAIPRYYLCKPSTKQWQVLPNPKTKYFTEKTAMTVIRTKPLWYKIIRLSNPKPRNNWDDYVVKRLRCEIFDSRTFGWKQLQDVKLPFGVHLENEQAIPASGALHWLTTNKHILAFDVESENWTLFALPMPLHDEGHEVRYIKIVQYKDELAVMYRAGGSGGDEMVDIWIMEDYRNKLWRKGGDFGGELFKKPGYVYPLGFYDGETALFSGYHGLLFYNFKNRISNVVEFRSINIELREIFPFQTDFEPCDLRPKGE